MLTSVATYYYDEMPLPEVQGLYDKLCKKYNKLSVKAYIVSGEEESLELTTIPLDYKGLYIEWPFRKIFLNKRLYNNRTIYHEIFHHINPHLKDGLEFERLLDQFMIVES